MAAGEVVSVTQLNWTERAVMSEQMWPPGVCVGEVWVEHLSCGQVEVRAELSDGCFLQLIRTDGDLARMMKRLVDTFPEDREALSSSLLTGEQTQCPLAVAVCVSVNTALAPLLAVAAVPLLCQCCLCVLCHYDVGDG